MQNGPLIAALRVSVSGLTPNTYVFEYREPLGKVQVVERGSLATPSLSLDITRESRESYAEVSLILKLSTPLNTPPAHRKNNGREDHKKRQLSK